ncbi:MAG: hypothetical protein IJH20_02515 [Bacilli bacterium]|nr:hypothetical protein [Bacilli bacterium]
MVLIISLVLIVTLFLLSYANFRKDVYNKKGNDKVKTMQIFALTWALVSVTAIATYCVISYFINGNPFVFM